LKILIVDDDPIMILELRAVVEELGEVYAASSGQSAVATARDHIPDIVLLDIGLPDIDGFDVLKEINENQDLNGVNVIVITSNSSFETHLKALSSGATDFITKPVNGRLLQQKINNIHQLSEKIEAKAVDRADQTIKSLKVRFKNLLGMLSEAVIITDENGVIQAVNDYSEHLFDYKNEELIGQNIKVLVPDIINDYMADYKVTGEATSIGLPKETECLKKNGNLIRVEMNLTHYADPAGAHFLVLIRDLSEKQLTQARLLKAALYDDLTGSFSRSALELDAEKLQISGEGNSFLACLVDVDRFHELNAVYGHNHCDSILRTLARGLRTLLKDLPVRIYRVSGDVFIIKSFRTVTDTEYNFFKSQLIDSFRCINDVISKEVEHRTTISAVASIFDVDILKNGALISMLEDALRLNKEKGHCGELSFVDHSTYGATVQFSELSQALLNGIDTTTLDVVYQPKVNVAGKIMGAEALLRWNDDFFYPLNLADYIESAENTGAIIEVGYFVIEKVCQTITELRARNLSIQFSINLSLRQFADRSLVQNTVEITRRYEVNPRLITFEITETAIAKNVDVISTALYLLKEQGFSLSVDDFGTGQSNLRYIHRLPIDEVKIDKSFIDDIEQLSHSYPIVDTIINMANSMNLQLVAEGVETRVQLNYLKQKQCGLIQGFYFYKPMEKAHLIKSLEHSSTIRD
jgi:PAS domain S-box-containing protein/diguanylate cyclase (GGDEF)-like protein